MNGDDQKTAKPDRRPMRVVGDRVEFLASSRAKTVVPVLESVFELRFSPIFSLLNEAPAAFQAALKDRFPVAKFSLLNKVDITFGQDPVALNPSTNQVSQPVYEFSTPKGIGRVKLTADSLSVTGIADVPRRAFIDDCTAVFLHFQQCFGMPEIKRIGCRFVVIVDRHVLGITDLPWDQLISRVLLGATAGHHLGPAVEGAIQNFVWRRPGGKLSFTHGLARVQGPEPRTGYLLDGDFSHDGADTESTDHQPAAYREPGPIERLDQAFRELDGLLRWATRSPLHRAVAKWRLEQRRAH